ncbi:MAG: tRNA lysidine(34) synthetase TilS, partial [Thermodesulfobacteriota bacterium]
DGLGLDHVEAALDLALTRDRGGLDLPGGLRAWVEADRFYLGRPPVEARLEYEYPLEAPGEVLIPETGRRIKAVTGPRPAVLDLKGLGPFSAVLDLDRISPPLCVRSPRPGDRFRPLGLAGAKKLSDFFIDLGVPLRERARTPLVADQAGLLWVAGGRLDHRVRVRPETRRLLWLTLAPEE